MAESCHRQAEQAMKYGTIAEGKTVNRAIYRCFELIPEEEARKFVKKFREQPHNGPQVNHSFRELILGAYLWKQGIKVSHDYMIEQETPDWCLIQDKACGIVELVNFHTAQ